MNENKNTFFPIFINMAGRRAVVYGGGVIAARRVEALLRFGAAVFLFAPEVSEEVVQLLKSYPETLHICEQPFRHGIPEADFVCSAVDDKAADKAIFRECKARGIPVNIASDRSMCDFYFPALVESQDLVLGLSSGGRDHGKVKRMAHRLREFLKETSDEKEGGA